MAEQQQQQQHSNQMFRRKEGWIDNVDDDVEPPRIPSFAHVVLDLPPSCMEFAPAGLLQDYFVVGTYHLESSEDGKDRKGGQERDEPAAVQQVRSGSLMLFQLQGGRELYDKIFLSVSFQIKFANVCSNCGCIIMVLRTSVFVILGEGALASV